MTIDKKPAEGTRVGKADALRANPGAPADEYLVPVNAKAVAGISDRYDGFHVRPNGWSDVATLTFTFSRPVRNPRLHVAGTGGATVDAAGNREDYWSGLRLVGGSPSIPTFSNAAGFPGFEVGRREIVPQSVRSGRATTCGVVYMCGTAQVNGMISSFTVELRARNVRRSGPAGDPFMWGVFRVTFEEDDSDAPQSYGAASHGISDVSIGSGVTADNLNRVGAPARRLSASDADDGWLARAALDVQEGGPLRMTIPVHAAHHAALAGWIDFNGDGRFQPDERASTAVTPNATRAILTWPHSRRVRPGQSWLRLRMSADDRQVLSPTGWAATGEVEDHRIDLRVPGVRVSHSAKPARARKGEVLTFTTRVENPSRLTLPYQVTVQLDDVLDDAKYRAAAPRASARNRSHLTWRGSLQPGATRDIKLRVVVNRARLGDGKVIARWSGSGIAACASPSTSPRCATVVQVRPRPSA